MATNDNTLKLAAELEVLLSPGKIDVKKVEQQLQKDIAGLVSRITKSAKTGQISLSPELTGNKKEMDAIAKQYRTNAEDARALSGDVEEAFNARAQAAANASEQAILAQRNEQDARDKYAKKQSASEKK